jgi:hypothetical protein
MPLSGHSLADPERFRRWQTLSGESALHDISGLSFDDLVREAEAVHAA